MTERFATKCAVMLGLVPSICCGVPTLDLAACGRRQQILGTAPEDDGGGAGGQQRTPPDRSSGVISLTTF